MSSRRYKVKFSVSGLKVDPRGTAEKFSHNRSVIGTIFKSYVAIMAVIGLVITFAPTSKLPEYSASTLDFNLGLTAPSDYNVSFEGGGSGYLQPKAIEKTVAVLRIGSDKNTLRFKGVTLKILGKYIDDCENFVMIDKETGENFRGKKDGAYIVFSDVLKKIWSGTNASFEIKTDFSSKQFAGESFSLAIDNSNDLDVSFNGEFASNNAHFPLVSPPIFMIGDTE